MQTKESKTRMKKIILFFVIINIMSGCGDTGTYRRLAEIDTLLYKDMDDSARHEIGRIYAEDLRGERETAYYNLLKTQVIFRQGIIIKDDSLIDRSIDYYRHVGDKHKLAHAFYYKGRCMYKRGLTKEGTRFLKEAEHMSESIDDNLLKAKIYYILGYFNLQADEFLMSLEYSGKGMEYSQKIRNNDILLCCFENIAAAYAGLDNIDSVMFYMEQCAPMAEFVSDKDKALIFANLAAAYEYIDAKRAKEYVAMANNVCPHKVAYYVLASILSGEGNYAAADSCYIKALSLCNEPGDKIGILQGMFECMQKTGRYKEAAEITGRIISLRDSLSVSRRADSIKEVQLLYDMSLKERKAEGQADISALTICLLAAGMSILLSVSVMLRRRARGALETSRQLMSRYAAEQEQLQKEIDKLEKSKEDKSRQVSALKRKLKTLEENSEKEMARQKELQRKMMAEGRSLYEHITGGGTNAKWYKHEYACFFEFYATVHPETAVLSADKCRMLTDGERLFVCLQELGMDDDHICTVMRSKKESLRVMRKRIADKEREA